MSPTTCKRISRSHWTALPVLSDFICWMNQMGMKQKMPRNLAFSDTCRAEIKDALGEYEESNTDNNSNCLHQPLDNKESSHGSWGSDGDNNGNDDGHKVRSVSFKEKPGQIRSTKKEDRNSATQMKIKPDAEMQQTESEDSPKTTDPDGANTGVYGENTGVHGKNIGVDNEDAGVHSKDDATEERSNNDASNTSECS